MQIRIKFILHYKSDLQKNIIMHKMSWKKAWIEKKKFNQAWNYFILKKKTKIKEIKNRQKQQQKKRPKKKSS